jgi:glutaconate CoA-transferase, subunit A
MNRHTSKIVSLADAVANIGDGAVVGLGGWIFNSQPMALVRALVRQGAKALALIPSPGSIAPDLLIGAGRAKSTTCTFISFEQHGLAPHFRRAAEAGAIEVREMDGPGFAGGLRAAICDLPYMPIPDLATDLPKVNPAFYRPIANEGGRRLLAVAPLRPDVCFIHAQQADELGNVQFLGAPFFDVMLAMASRRVVVSVDRIVSTDTIRRSNHLTKLPSAMVHSVVEVPFGAHPTSSASLYRADNSHLAEYVKSATAEAFPVYMERYVIGPVDHARYLDTIGAAQLAALGSSERPG